MISPIAQNELSHLKPHQDRLFLPPNCDLRDPQEVQRQYERLLNEAIQSSEDLERWVHERSELESAMDQQEALLYIQMTCQTDDAQKASAYQKFVENVEPVVHRMEHKLNGRYVQLSGQFPLDQQRYGVMDREIKSDISLFRDENVGLATKVSLKRQEYQKICGAMTVYFEGKEQTLPQMAKYSLVPDRNVREEAWRATAGRRLRDADKLESLFDRMLLLRNRIALNAGCRDYEDYQFRAKHRYDYTPEDCRKYHAAVEHCVVPLWKERLKRRRRLLGADSLRPWDLNVDPQGRPPLKPFEKVEELVGGVRDIFERTDPRLGSQFQQMIDQGLLDLASRKGKAPGGYQFTLAEARRPFIFMNAVGIDADVRTLLHEGGHAFHAFACAGDPLYDYRHGPMEFNEVASMGMELMAGEHLRVFYNEEDFRRSQLNHLEDAVFVLAWVALIDAFQEWIYANPGHKDKQRRDKWVELHQRFGTGEVDWSGLKDERSCLWHRQLHIFESPFYYIEYGIAQLGALQLWLNAKEDKPRAMDRYLRALSLGGSRPLPEIFQAAGLSFDFSRTAIAPLVQALEEELARYE